MSTQVMVGQLFTQRLKHQIFKLITFFYLSVLWTEKQTCVVTATWIFTFLITWGT